MPSITPFHVTRCVPGSACFSALNPDYPLVFVLSIAATGVLFFGLFGRGFVINPVFVAAMAALEYGLAGAVSALLSGHDPEIFAPLVAIGAVGLGIHAIRHRPGRAVAGAGSRVEGGDHQ